MRRNPQQLKDDFEGKYFFSKSVGKKFKVLKVNNFSDVLVEFEDDKYQMKTNINAIKSGGVGKFKPDDAVIFTDTKKKYENMVIQTNEGYLVKVVEYIPKGNKVRVKFLDNDYETITTTQNFRNGEIHNPYHRNKFGGYSGIGEFYLGGYDNIYAVWYNMLVRCKDSEYYDKYHTYQQGTYENTDMCDEWLNYNTFANWYKSEYDKIENPMDYIYNIDKDIKYYLYKDKYNGMKFYAPDTVVLIPKEINVILSNYTDFSNVINSLTEKANKYYNEKSITLDTYIHIANFIEFNKQFV